MFVALHSRNLCFGVWVCAYVHVLELGTHASPAPQVAAKLKDPPPEEKKEDKDKPKS